MIALSIALAGGRFVTPGPVWIAVQLAGLVVPAALEVERALVELAAVVLS